MKRNQVISIIFYFLKNFHLKSFVSISEAL